MAEPVAASAAFVAYAGPLPLAFIASSYLAGPVQ